MRARIGRLSNSGRDSRRYKALRDSRQRFTQCGYKDNHDRFEGIVMVARLRHAIDDAGTKVYIVELFSKNCARALATVWLGPSGERLSDEGSTLRDEASGQRYRVSNEPSWMDRL
jgi:hypothetical protein